jgi:hypothetical protein
MPMRNDDGKPSVRRRMFATHLVSVVLGALFSGVVVGVFSYLTLEKHYWQRWQLANRERKGYLAEMAARTLARLRTGNVDDAVTFLEDKVDMYIVGVPMGESYPEMSYDCQHALAMCKIYRSRFAFPGGCKLHGDELHFKHVPSLLADVPLLPADDDWLDGPMRKVREMPALAGECEERSSQ